MKHNKTITGKIKFAVIGLGRIAQMAMLPAFAKVKRKATLGAIISDDPEKLAAIGDSYGVEGRANYKDLEDCLQRHGIHAAYIATPNSTHLDLVRLVAKIGVHVLCEKPLGVTAKESGEMVRICKRAGVKLMTAYRLHFEAANSKALQLVQRGAIGEARLITSIFSYQVKGNHNIRLRSDLGGGPLHDIGIYSLHAARKLFDAEPTGIHAWASNSGDTRFKEVDETVTVMMRFGNDRIATFTCSFGLAAESWLQVVGTKGSLRLDPAFEYKSGLSLHTKINNRESVKHYPKQDQFAAQLIHFAECIKHNKAPNPSGEDGHSDNTAIDSMMRSLRTGKSVSLSNRVYTT